jgi:dTDP-4-amino-4,6-dideoxy-D-galactose acyltransferase
MTGAAVELLAWDTEWWGVTTGRTTARRLDRALLAEIDSACAALDVELLYHRSAADDQESTRLAQESGFRVVDVRLAMAAPVPLPAPSVPDRVRLVRPEDGARLGDIAAVSHRNTRFFADGYLPEERCQALYRAWIEGDLRGRADAVYVVDDGDGPVGYLSVVSGAGRIAIGLVAVATSARRGGAGTDLVTAAMAWSADHGYDVLDVVTQGGSTPAQRLYQRFGFTTTDVDLWFHRWSPRPPGGRRTT